VIMVVMSGCVQTAKLQIFPNTNGVKYVVLTNLQLYKKKEEEEEDKGPLPYHHTFALLQSLKKKNVLFSFCVCNNNTRLITCVYTVNKQRPNKNNGNSFPFCTLLLLVLLVLFVLLVLLVLFFFLLILGSYFFFTICSIFKLWHRCWYNVSSMLSCHISSDHFNSHQILIVRCPSY